MKKLNNYSKIQKKNNKNCNRANLYNTISTLFSSTNINEKIPNNCANQNIKFVKQTDNINELLSSNISSDSEDNSSGRLIYNNIFFKKNNNSDNSILSDSIIKNTIQENIPVNNENILDREHLIKNLNNTFIIISNLLKNLFIIAIKFFNNMLLFTQSQLLDKNNDSQNIKIPKKKKKYNKPTLNSNTFSLSNELDLINSYNSNNDNNKNYLKKKNKYLYKKSSSSDYSKSTSNSKSKIKSNKYLSNDSNSESDSSISSHSSKASKTLDSTSLSNHLKLPSKKFNLLNKSKKIIRGRNSIYKKIGLINNKFNNSELLSTTKKPNNKKYFKKQKKINSEKMNNSVTKPNTNMMNEIYCAVNI